MPCWRTDSTQTKTGGEEEQRTWHRFNTKYPGSCDTARAACARSLCDRDGQLEELCMLCCSAVQTKFASDHRHGSKCEVHFRGRSCGNKAVHQSADFGATTGRAVGDERSITFLCRGLLIHPIWNLHHQSYPDSNLRRDHFGPKSRTHRAHR